MLISFLFIFGLFFPFKSVRAQTIKPVILNDEKLSFIGMTLTQLIEKKGIPRSVAAVRGEEIWQDDVVFQYADADFYIHKDRVWQARFTAACGISTRDRKTAVIAHLGNTAEDNGEYALLSIPGKTWPVTLRVNFNPNGQVVAIYIYRPDF